MQAQQQRRGAQLRVRHAAAELGEQVLAAASSGGQAPRIAALQQCAGDCCRGQDHGCAGIEQARVERARQRPASAC